MVNSDSTSTVPPATGWLATGTGSLRTGPWLVKIRPCGGRRCRLHSDAVLTQSVGQIYNTITNGVDREKNGNLSMPAYAAQISPRDRWAIVLYVLALQRSRNALTTDLPADELKTLQIRDLEQ